MSASDHDDDLPDFDIDAAGAFLCDPGPDSGLGRRIFKRTSFKRCRDEFRAEARSCWNPRS